MPGVGGEGCVQGQSFENGFSHHYLKGVLLAERCWPDTHCWLYSFVIFKGVYVRKEPLTVFIKDRP